MEQWEVQVELMINNPHLLCILYADRIYHFMSNIIRISAIGVIHHMKIWAISSSSISITTYYSRVFNKAGSTGYADSKSERGKALLSV